MLVKLLNYSFILTSSLLILSIILFKLYVSKLKDNMKSSAFVALIAVFLGLYVIFAITLGFIYKNILSTFIMFLFGLSPFIIGKLATYEKEKYYTMFQLFTVFVSIIYVMIS